MSARDDLLHRLVDDAGLTPHWAGRQIDAYRDEVALEIGRDVLRDGLGKVLPRLVGDANAERLLADFIDSLFTSEDGAA